MIFINDEWELHNVIGDVEGFSLESITDDNAQLLTVFETKKLFNEQYFTDMKRVIEVSKLIGLEGMNVSLASILDEIIPGFINDEMPISAFTKDPTIIQKQYAFKKLSSYCKQALTEPKYRTDPA
jgi:hypothetical protein